MVTSLKYLGILILGVDDDWPSAVLNLVKAQMVWRRMSRILIREGVRPRVSSFFFRAVVQLVFLFGAYNWLVNPCMGRSLGGFHYQVARRPTGRLPWWILDGRWDYTLAGAAIAKAGFETM